MSDSPINMYRVGPRQLRGFILECLYAGLVPFIRGSPGTGKSEIVESVNDELNLWMIDHRLSTSEPTDMTGLPDIQNNRACFAPFEELFPLEGTPIPEGKSGWMIFFDEMNAASKAVQAASYKVLLDRKIGQHNLHPNVVIVAAGNLDSDRAITNPIGTALQSRVIHLELEVSHDDWMLDVAIKRNYDARIIAFLSQYPSKLMDFRPDHNEKTFCCPRTWSFMNRLIQGKPINESSTPLYAGTITSAVAAEFVQFSKIFLSMISIKEVLADPSFAPMPSDNSTRWALISHLMEKLEPENFESLAIYANRFPMDFRIIFFRSVLIRKPALRRHTAFIKVQSELSRYIFN